MDNSQLLNTSEPFILALLSAFNLLIYGIVGKRGMDRLLTV